MKKFIATLDNYGTKINPRYDANLESFAIIKANSEKPFDLMFYGFNYGFMQGHKAALAEMKKKARAK